MSIKQNGDSVAFTGSGYKVLGACLLGFIGLMGIPPLVSDRTFAQAVGGVVVLGTGVLWIGWLRASVTVGHSQLVLRTPFRTRKLEWFQVKEAKVVPTNGNRLFAIVMVATTDGARIRVEGVGSRWRRAGGTGGVYRIVEEINRRASAARNTEGF